MSTFIDVIYCRTEAAGEVISSENVQTTERYALLNFESASISINQSINQAIKTREAQASLGCHRQMPPL